MPGVLIALGVISLFVALASFSASTQTAVVLFRGAIRSIPPRSPASPPPLPAVSLQPYQGQINRAGGLSRDQRAAALAHFHLEGPFAADRREMLERLLAEAGGQIMGATDANAAPLAPRQRATPDDVWAPDTFQAPGGRIELSNTAATFFPAAGGGPISVQLERAQRHEGLYWSGPMIDERVATLRAALPGLTELQIAAIRQLLDQPITGATARPSPWSVTPNQSPQIEIGNAQLGAGNVLSVWVNGESWFILPDGRSATARQAPYGVDPARGGPRPAPPPPFFPAVRGSLAAIWMLAGRATLSAILAIFLFVAGIRALSGSVAGVSWHVRWAGLKGLLIVAEVGISLWFLASLPALSQANPFLRRRAGPPSWMMASGVMPYSGTVVAARIFVQCIYPAVVLIAVFGLNSMRRFYNPRSILGGADRARQRNWLTVKRDAVWLMAAFAGALGIGHIAVGVLMGAMAGQNGVSIIAIVVSILLGGTLLLACVIAVRRLLSGPEPEGTAS